MITPDTTGGNATTCIPVAALAIDGIAPTAGDSVEFNGKGTIESVDGEHAYVALAEVNGEPVTQPAGEPDQDDMMKMAEQADMEG